MYGITLVIVFALAGVHCQDAVPVLVPQGEKILGQGSKIVLSCSVQTDQLFLFHNQVLFRFTDKAGIENIVSSTGALREPYSDMTQNYELSIAPGNPLVINLTLMDIQPKMDGKYACQIAPLGVDDPNEVTSEAILDVKVAAGISEIKMTVNGMESGTSMTLDKGTYPVVCEAKGSNPEGVIHMHIGDEDLDVGMVTSILDTESTAEQRTFKTSVSFDLDFDHKYYGKSLSCHAETVLPDGMTLQLDDAETSMVLNGVVVEPEIHCVNSTAAKGYRRVELICYVARHTPIKQALFNINNNILLYPGNKTENHDEVLETRNETYIILTLKLYEVDDWHIDADIYLDVIGMDDSKYQYPVIIIKGEDDGVSAAPRLVTGAITLPALVLLAVCLRMLIQ